MYKWIPTSQTHVQRLTNCFEEGKALEAKTLRLGASVQALQRHLGDVGGKICSSCGWESPEMHFPLCNLSRWTPCVHGPPTCPHYVTPPCSLSLFTLWPEVVFSPFHFSKLDLLGLHWQACCWTCSVDPEHACAAGPDLPVYSSGSCWADGALLQDLQIK